MKPKVKLTGQDENIFNLIAICSKALKRNNQIQQEKEMTQRVYSCNSYENAIQIMSEYCEIC